MKLKLLSLLFLTLLAPGGYAADKFVADVRFQSSTFRQPTPKLSEPWVLRFDLHLDPAHAHCQIHQVRITQAVDALGNSLQTSKPAWSPPFSMRMQNMDPDTLPTWAVAVQSPTNAVKTIKAISGEIDLYYPTIQNGGVVTVSNFIAKAGQMLDQPGLSSDKIKIMVLDQASFNLKEVAIQKAHLSHLPLVDPMDKIFDEEFFKSSGSFFPAPGTSPIWLLIDDPDSKLLGAGFVDGSNQMVLASGSQTDPHRYFYDFDTPPLPSWTVKIYVDVPGAVQTATFRVENMVLK